MKRHTVVVSLLVALAAGAAGAGPLGPPAGPMRPAMKPLDQLEPRIAVNATNTPGDADSIFRITKPGSYYLLSSMTGAPGKAGIEIDADNVTLDLMGFTLQGAPGSLEGIVMTGAGHANLTVRDGVVRGWGKDGIDFVSPSSPGESCRVEGVVSADNVGGGIVTGVGSVVRACVATGNGDVGIFADAGSIVEASSARRNAVGIHLGDDSKVRDSLSELNRTIGIFVSAGGTVTGCAAHFNADTGIFGVHNATIADSTAAANTGDGISIVEGSVRRCTVRRNTRDGISVSGRCLIEGNEATGNGAGAFEGSGIRVHGNGGRIRDNQLAENDRGIYVTGARNLVVGNTATDSELVNFEIVAGNSVGKVVVVKRGDAVAGDVGGAGVGTTDPWANLSY